MSIRNKSNANSSITQNGRTLNKRVSNGVAVYDNGSSSGSSGSGGFSNIVAILTSGTRLYSSRGTYYYFTGTTTDPMNFPCHGPGKTHGMTFQNDSGSSVLITSLMQNTSQYTNWVASYNPAGYGSVGTIRLVRQESGVSTRNAGLHYVLIPAGARFVCNSTKPDTATKGFNAAGGIESYTLMYTMGDINADQIKTAMDSGTLSTLLSNSTSDFSGLQLTHL